MRRALVSTHVLFLAEARTDALRVLEELCRAVGDTFGLSAATHLLVGEGLARKVVAAAGEAALNEASVEAHKVLHLLLLDDLLHGELFAG